MTDAFRAKLRWRVRRHCLSVLLRLLGRPVRCDRCGRTLFLAIPFVRDGRVRLLGAEESDVRIAFTDKDSLRARHLYLDHCPAPERPWVP